MIDKNLKTQTSVANMMEAHDLARTNFLKNLLIPLINFINYTKKIAIT